eukprot:1193422-Alexandrium_andersonii.AAC.1
MGSQGPNLAHGLPPAFRCFLQPRCAGVQASGHSTMCRVYPRRPPGSGLGACCCTVTISLST